MTSTLCGTGCLSDRKYDSSSVRGSKLNQRRCVGALHGTNLHIWELAPLGFKFAEGVKSKLGPSLQHTPSCYYVYALRTASGVTWTANQ
jgi:hypothetical protein